MATLKYKLESSAATSNQPKRAGGGGLVSVRGATELVVYVEPADETLTDYTIRPGYLQVAGGIDADRVMYSYADEQTVAAIATPGTLLGFQEAEGRYWRFAVPPGSDFGYVRVTSVTAGTVNMLVWSA